MTESHREEEELENLEGLDEIDVTDCAEDDEQLKRRFREKVIQISVPRYLKAHQVNPLPDSLRGQPGGGLDNYWESIGAGTQPKHFRDRYKIGQRRGRRQVLQG